MPDKDNFIITGNASAANNQFSGVGKGGGRNTGGGPMYGRVIQINTADRSIKYELIKNTLATSALNSPTKVTGTAYNFNPTMTRLPVVGEIVPLVIGPSNRVGSLANQYDDVVYYQSPIAIQNTVDNNAVPQETPPAATNVNNDYKLNNVGVSKPNDNNNTPKERFGTDADGINGQFTSQFLFPASFSKLIIDLVGKPTDIISKALGIPGNSVLISIAQNLNLTLQNMEDWNKFVEWMGTKKYKGSKDMNSKAYQKNVWVEYKSNVKKDFWINYIRPDNTSDDVVRVQNALKIYRAYLINEWKKGTIYAPGIKFKDNNGNDLYMNPKKPEDVIRVEENFMIWAKPKTYR